MEDRLTIYDDDPLAPRAPEEPGGGCAGCALAFVAMFGGLIGIGYIATLGVEFGGGLFFGLVAFVAYAGYFPTAARRKRVRRRRVRRLVNQRGLAGTAVDTKTITIPLGPLASATRARSPDAQEDAGARQRLTRARSNYAVRFTAAPPVLRVPAAALPPGKPWLAPAMLEIEAAARWLAEAADPQLAWWTALVLGEEHDPTVVGGALRALLAYAPADPLTHRVRARALQRPGRRMRLAAAVAALDGPTLDELGDVDCVARLSADDVLDLTTALLRVAERDGRPRDGVVQHAHPAVRLAFVLDHRSGLTDDELVLLAGDVWQSTRDIAWVTALSRGEDVALSAARRVVQAVDATGGHPMIDRARGRTVDARQDPMPEALVYLGEHGGPEDARLISAHTEDRTYGKTARRARARLSERLGDRLSAGHLSLTAVDSAGGLSMEPAPDGALSNTPGAVEGEGS